MTKQEILKSFDLNLEVPPIVSFINACNKKGHEIYHYSNILGTVDHYLEELTLKEISNVLEVSESRVSQLHTKGLQKMKGKLGKYIGVLEEF